MVEQTIPVPQGEEYAEYSEDGVDVSLIRWFLSFTPEERLRFLQLRMDDIRAIRRLNERR